MKIWDSVFIWNCKNVMQKKSTVHGANISKKSFKKWCVFVTTVALGAKFQIEIQRDAFLLAQLKIFLSTCFTLITAWNNLKRAGSECRNESTKMLKNVLNERAEKEGGTLPDEYRECEFFFSALVSPLSFRRSDLDPFKTGAYLDQSQKTGLRVYEVLPEPHFLLNQIAASDQP